MDREGKFWFSLWTVIALMVVTIVITLSTHNYMIQKNYVEKGYIQVHVPDVAVYLWQKVDGN